MKPKLWVFSLLALLLAIFLFFKCCRCTPQSDWVISGKLIQEKYLELRTVQIKQQLDTAEQKDGYREQLKIVEQQLADLKATVERTDNDFCIEPQGICTNCMWNSVICCPKKPGGNARLASPMPCVFSDQELELPGFSKIEKGGRFLYCPPISDRPIKVPGKNLVTGLVFKFEVSTEGLRVE